jgi:hypothetical protein
MENREYWEERVKTLEACRPAQLEERVWRHERELALSRQIIKNLKEQNDAHEATAA